MYPTRKPTKPELLELSSLLDDISLDQFWVELHKKSAEIRIAQARKLVKTWLDSTVSPTLTPD